MMTSAKNKMNISVTEKAHAWFKKEFDLENGDGIRFFGKLYGKTAVHDNYSLGMQYAQPNDVLAQVDVDGVIYFIEKSDEWFFSGYDFHVDYDENADEPLYSFT
ncbi:HesB/YadR/YfhF family protein [Virgibacillus soli]